jgi:hypothetical protein
MNRRYRKLFRVYDSASSPSRSPLSALDLSVHSICVTGSWLLIAVAQNLARGSDTQRWHASLRICLDGVSMHVKEQDSFEGLGYFGTHHRIYRSAYYRDYQRV